MQKDTIDILFVCHGNIARSPMAEYLMKDLVNKQGFADRFHIESAATSNEEIGNPVHAGPEEILAKRGIDTSDKRARRISRADYARFDFLIGMDSRNIKNMVDLWSGDPERKVFRLLEFASREDDIADPGYTDDFETTYHDVSDGCVGLLAYLRNAIRP